MGESVARQGVPAMALIFDGVVKRFENPMDDPHYTHLHLVAGIAHSIPDR